MIDIVLLGGRIAIIAFLYLFLLLAINTGVGQVKGKNSKRGRGSGGALSFMIAEGPQALVGTKFPAISTLVVGRSASSDITVSDDFVSGSHARITPVEGGAVLEDLGSTNGTLLNGAQVHSPQSLRPGDRIQIGTLVMVVDAE